ncbi:MAG: hypothetical protein DRN53_06015 [Thermoprotei archaeon]|nr:MAG: hypothetical protein DRN53_06015 [Thermoprotei archaeon]
MCYLLIAYLEEKYVIVRIEHEDTGNIKLKYTGSHRLAMKLLRLGGIMLTYVENPPLGDRVWELSVLVYRDKIVEVCWEMLTTPITDLEWSVVRWKPLEEWLHI